MEKQLKLPSEFRKTKGNVIEGKNKDTKPNVSDFSHNTGVKRSRSKVDEELGILRAFDLDSKYGPCVGITRLHRWERAKKLGLNPPDNVYIILSHVTDPEYAECLWKNEKGLVP